MPDHLCHQYHILIGKYNIVSSQLTFKSVSLFSPSGQKITGFFLIFINIIIRKDFTFFVNIVFSRQVKIFKNFKILGNLPSML